MNSSKGLPARRKCVSLSPVRLFGQGVDPASQRPLQLGGRQHQAPALRQPEVAESAADLRRLLHVSVRVLQALHTHQHTQQHTPYVHVRAVSTMAIEFEALGSDSLLDALRVHIYLYHTSIPQTLHTTVLHTAANVRKHRQWQYTFFNKASEVSARVLRT